MEKNNNSKKYQGKGAVWALTVIVLAAALGFFVWWGLTVYKLTIPGVIAAALSLALFTLALVLAIPALVRFLSGSEREKAVPAGDRSSRRTRMHPAIRVILTVLAARLLVMLIAYVMATVAKGYFGSIFTSAETIWTKLDTDAPHYFSIAENWYTTTEPQMYTIVFLPLFPLLIRLFNFVTGNSFVSAMIINTLCTCGAGACIYELALCDMGRRSARLAVLFALAMPAAIFFIAPMSEALFILLCSASLLCVRKEKFLIGAVLGALAAFTRSVGVLLAVPFAVEALGYCIRLGKAEGKKAVGAFFRLALYCLIIPLGTFGYLLINKLVWGDWFKFLEFQREIWYQSLGPFFGTAATHADMLVSSFGSDTADLIGLWLPNVLFTFGALIVFVASARVLHPSYSLYFAAYFAVTCGATWLLSAPRYLTALVVLPLALAHLCESRDDGIAIGRARTKTTIVTSVLIIGQLAYLLMYILDYSIY